MPHPPCVVKWLFLELKTLGLPVEDRPHVAVGPGDTVVHLGASRR